MNHKDKLLEVYEKAFNIDDVDVLPNEIEESLSLVISKISRSKGVYTVLITLLVHKIINPSQDVRYFQNKMEGGFSARTIDTKYITPTLKELGLPSMAESGWLTRSLEQPYPYTMTYEGEISGVGMKKAFLNIIDYFENNPSYSEDILRKILNGAIKEREDNKVIIKKINNSDDIFISNIIELLDEHFNYNYKTHGGSKLPVIAFFATYKILIEEIGRYKECNLEDMGSHTASDRTSKSAGDIEVSRNEKIFEAVEVKLDKPVDINMARIAYEKIARFGVERYYILSYIGIKEEDKSEVEVLIKQIKDEHGCQLIVNGLLHTLRYYLRLISSPVSFFNIYIDLVEQDSELKKIHKDKLKELIEKYNM